MYKHTITLTILSEEEDLSDLTLSDLDYEITDGQSIGSYKIAEVKALTKDEAITAIYALGSEPSFFYPDEDID